MDGRLDLHALQPWRVAAGQRSEASRKLLCSRAESLLIGSCTRVGQAGDQRNCAATCLGREVQSVRTLSQIKRSQKRMYL